MRKLVKNVPVVGPAARWLNGRIASLSFPGSGPYWESRYQGGGTSGAGSSGRLARFKADTLNRFVMEQSVVSVLELGCGDGGQLALAAYPRYLGLDISPAAVEVCRQRFQMDATKAFAVLDDREPEPHDLTLSLDVIYHLVEDAAFDAHMALLFGCASRFVAIYSSNAEHRVPEPHIRHRNFTAWVNENCPDWTLMRFIANPFPYSSRDQDNTSLSDFYFYRRR